MAMSDRFLLGVENGEGEESAIVVETRLTCTQLQKDALDRALAMTKKW